MCVVCIFWCLCGLFMFSVVHACCMCLLVFMCVVCVLVFIRVAFVWGCLGEIRWGVWVYKFKKSQKIWLASFLFTTTIIVY